MLLSQSQVSTLLTTTLVVVFTLLLFLCGYSYQQQTVQGLHDELRPRIPRNPSSKLTQAEPTPAASPSRFFGHRSGRVIYADLRRDIHAGEEAAQIDWTRRAHAQLVTRHHDVCNAIMVLAELHMLRSPARRVLLFPRKWADERRKIDRHDVSDPYLDTTRYLLRTAARRFNIELRPIEPISGASGAGDGKDSDQYSMVSAFALHTDFDRVLMIETPGLLLDAEPLDALLAFTEPAPLAMLHDTHENDGVHSEDLYLLEPTSASHARLMAHFPSEYHNDTDLFNLFPEPLLLASSSEEIALIRSIGTLHEATDAFNRTAFTSDAAYIRFSDPKLPGPEYDVPWEDKLAARPTNKDADWTWTKLYGQFAQERLDVCGLGLEAWVP